MSVEQAIITLGSALFLILFGALGFFMKSVIDESRKNAMDIGRIQGLINSNRESAEGKINSTKDHVESRIEILAKVTDSQIKHLTEDVTRLTGVMSDLMEAMFNKKGNGGFK